MGSAGRHSAGRHSAAAPPAVPTPVVPPAPVMPLLPQYPDSVEYVAYTPGWESPPVPPPMAPPQFPSAPSYAPAVDFAPSYAPAPAPGPSLQTPTPAYGSAAPAAPRPLTIRELLAASQAAPPQYDEPAPFGTQYPPGYGSPSGAPPYAPPPYASSSYGPAPYAPWDKPAAKRKMSSGLLALIVVLALVAVGTLGYGIWHANRDADGGSSTRSLALPQAIDEYAARPVADDVTMQQRVLSVLSDRLGISIPADAVQVQVYDYIDSGGTLAVIAFHVPEIPQLVDEIQARGLDFSMDDFAHGFTDGQAAVGGVTHLTDVDPGRSGGLMRCGGGSRNGNPVTDCLWGDNSYFGLVDIAGASGKPGPALTTDLRRVAEH